MDDQRFSISNVRQVREQLDVADQLFASLKPALNTKAKDCPISVRMVFSRQVVLRVAFETWIAYPIDRRMSFKEFRDTQRILTMTFHTQRQCFQTLQEEEGIEWRDSRTNVTQKLHAGFDNISQVTQCFYIAQSVIGRIRFSE